MKEKRDVLEQSITSIENQLALELSILKNLNQLETEINKALDEGNSQLQLLNETLSKTKEEVSNEIQNIKNETVWLVILKGHYNTICL